MVTDSLWRPSITPLAHASGHDRRVQHLRDRAHMLSRILCAASHHDQGPQRAAQKPHRTPGLVNEAFRRLLSGRRRPVGLECAMDTWARKAFSSTEQGSAAAGVEISSTGCGRRPQARHRGLQPGDQARSQGSDRLCQPRHGAHLHRSTRPGDRRFRRAIAAQPGQHQCLHPSLLRLRDERDFRRAIADLDEAIRLAPDSAAAYFYPAQLEALQEEARRAVAGYGEAVMRDPTNARIHLNRAALYEDGRGLQQPLHGAGDPRP